MHDLETETNVRQKRVLGGCPTNALADGLCCIGLTVNGYPTRLFVAEHAPDAPHVCNKEVLSVVGVAVAFELRDDGYQQPNACLRKLSSG